MGNMLPGELILENRRESIGGEYYTGRDRRNFGILRLKKMIMIVLTSIESFIKWGKMTEIKIIVKTYKSAERDKISFSGGIGRCF
jgi:hypothetical protein